MKKANIGVIGLAVMGKNLALNIAEHGFCVAVYNRSKERTQELINEEHPYDIMPAYSLKEFIQLLEKPRKIIMMVQAGSAVDQTIDQLIPLLDQGDIIMDGGNSYYLDTIKRTLDLKEKGILFLGTGISGGEEGARNGPAIMPGGSKEAYQQMSPILTAIAAVAQGEACCSYIGGDGAGHFVKMVHNGIEYADMQLIAEAYDLMKRSLHMDSGEIASVFEEWNTGELKSYLIEITADVLKKKDEKNEYLVEKILDVAGQKGTGKWTGQISLELGIPIPSITSAVYERYLSAYKEERYLAQGVLSGPTKTDVSFHVEQIKKALYASKICVYSQGFDMIQKASKQYGWNLHSEEIAKIFRGGCIIRAQFLNQISAAYQANHELDNLLLDPFFSDIVKQYQEDWRSVVAQSVLSGIAVPAFSSAIAYYDSYRTKKMPTNLIQAQRDYFGAHTYKREDLEGTFHTNWNESKQ